MSLEKQNCLRARKMNASISEKKYIYTYICLHTHIYIHIFHSACRRQVWMQWIDCSNRVDKGNCTIKLYLPWQPSWPATMESCHQDYQNSTYRLEMREKSSESYPDTVWALVLTPCDRDCQGTWLKHCIQQFWSKSFTKKTSNLYWIRMWNVYNIS